MNYTYLSSSATFFYKWVIPSVVFLLTIFFIIGSITFFPEKHAELYLPFSLFLIIFAFSLSPLIFLKKVYYDDNYLYLSNYRKGKQIEFNQVREVKMFLFYFYKISYEDEMKKFRSFIFMPHIFEKMSNPLGTLDSIRKLKNKCVYLGTR